MEAINQVELFLQTAMQCGTHILFAILGGIMCEKVGNTNLGIEGMMLLGCAFGYMAACFTGDPYIAMLTAAAAGAGGALIYAFITVTLKGNQVVTGIVLSIFGTGIAGFFGTNLTSKKLPESINNFFAPIEVPVLSKIPLIGKPLFDQSIFVIMPIIIAIVIYFVYSKTKIGLNTRAVGENPAAADASGINVSLYKYVNILLGGALCGLGGAYLSLVFIRCWNIENTAGAGWIAVALVIFATWNPLKAIFAAYAFGCLRGLSFTLQNTNLNVPSQLLGALPFVATILVLIFISVRKKRENQPPASLGNSYFREER